MISGIDIYISVAKADETVRQLFGTYDELRVFWSVLPDEEKESYLWRSTQQIDSLAYAGGKSQSAQRLQFPRNGERELSQRVINAVVYNALGLMNEEIKATAIKQKQIFKSLGAFQNIMFDQLSETVLTTGNKIPLASKTAYELLKPYRRGGFSIR